MFLYVFFPYLIIHHPHVSLSVFKQNDLDMFSLFCSSPALPSHSLHSPCRHIKVQHPRDFIAELHSKLEHLQQAELAEASSESLHKVEKVINFLQAKLEILTDKSNNWSPCANNKISKLQANTQILIELILLVNYCENVLNQINRFIEKSIKNTLSEEQQNLYLSHFWKISDAFLSQRSFFKDCINTMMLWWEHNYVNDSEDDLFMQSPNPKDKFREQLFEKFNKWSDRMMDFRTANATQKNSNIIVFLQKEITQLIIELINKDSVHKFFARHETNLTHENIENLIQGLLHFDGFSQDLETNDTRPSIATARI